MYACLQCTALNDPANLVCNVCGAYSSPAALADASATQAKKPPASVPPAPPPAAVAAAAAAAVFADESDAEDESDSAVQPPPPLPPQATTPSGPGWECEGCSERVSWEQADCLVCGCARPEGLLQPLMMPAGLDAPPEYDYTLSADDQQHVVLLPCDVCNRMYSADLLAQHLAGHFAFDETVRAEQRRAAEDASAAAAAAAAATVEAEEAEDDDDWSTDSGAANDWMLVGDEDAGGGLGGGDGVERQRRAAERAARAVAAAARAAEEAAAAEDRALAQRLQQEEVAAMLAGLQQRATDRVVALRLAAQDEDMRDETERLRKEHDVPCKAGASSSGGGGGGGGGASKAARKKEVLAYRQQMSANADAAHHAALQHCRWAADSHYATDSRAGGAAARGRLHAVTSSAEYLAVCEFFARTLGVSGRMTVVSLQRVVSPGALQRFVKHAPYSRGACDVRVMFHGCRTKENETSIISNGFQVRSCVSGGSNFGTWFAYNAAYSDGGYVYREAPRRLKGASMTPGVASIFVCLVSQRKEHEKLHNPQVMHVVGQDAAYPAYLLQYVTA